MNILQVIPYFVPAWCYGGPVPVAYNISKELVKRGHRVTVYTTDTLSADDRVEVEEEVIDGIRVRRFRNLSNWLAARHHLFLPLSLVKALRDNLEEFDVVHLHEHWVLWNVIVRRYAIKHHIPYLVQAHGSLPIMIAKQRAKRLYNTLFGYDVLRSATKVIALTSLEAEQYRGFGVEEGRIEVVPNGIDLSQYDNLPSPGIFKRKHSLEDSERVVLFVGRIHIIKGLDLLARAYARVSEQLDKVRLVIVGGDDGYLPQLKQLIGELGIGCEVILTGPLYGEDKLAAYVDADICVLPSLYEGSPISAFESCACGTPVVITDRCSIGGSIDGQAGIEVRYDEYELSKAIVRMLTDDEMKQEFGNNCRMLVREHFNWGKIVEQVEEIYSKVAYKLERKGDEHH